MAWRWNIRPAEGQDLPFIYSTWLKSYWLDSQSDKGVRKSTFFSEYVKVVDAILGAESTKTLVACHFDDPQVIFGYIVASPHCTHYAFVKEAFRKAGIAKKLFEEAGSKTIHTHRTNSLAPILKKHHELEFNPYVLFRKEEPNGKSDRAA